MPSNTPAAGAHKAGPVRRALDGLYLSCGRLAACFLVAICALVTAQVLGNALDRLLLWTTGRQIGIAIPAYADFAGFFLSASTFLGLAYTLTHGEHIRVRLLLGRLPAAWQRAAELWCSGAAAVVSGIATAYTVVLAAESVEFGDTLPGMVAVPLAIPQAVMAFGLLVLTVAFADAFCALCRGGRPHYEGKDGEDELAGLQGG